MFDQKQSPLTVYHFLQVANLQEEIEILGNQMAYMTVGISSYGGTQSIINPNHESQFLLQHNVLDTNYHENQPTGMPTHRGYTTGNQVSSNDMIAELLPLSPWEDLNFLCNSNLNTLERLFQGVDQEICAHYQCLDTCGNATDEVSPSCS
ncbi:uncharacterized protein LOC119989195 [Tripterygium wilfordii]|uniref:uncharacterized protein LOC119989195 n=1 Tax=Tripterygium wilfordii TaxID=458696 RepID=UPI0018F809C5|nr:uncharacterized protein LOC119989195 [Tripterygium wilfordii]